ncbi:hypothetical protein V5F29_07460 [Xanthobacter aminoxidans]|uniref:hypothetical protein n=1 Tax=Xanthobacter aminoxidans TaxID=186280 RepID=UPI003728C00A
MANGSDMLLVNARDHVERAKELLHKQGECCVYACLEARQAMECLIFDRLGLYRELIPESVSKGWKADKILSAIISLDSFVGRDLEIDIDGIKCVYRGINFREFRAKFNALGSFIHIQNPEVNSERRNISMIEICRDAIRIVEAALESEVQGVLIEFNSCTACSCGAKVPFLPAQIRSGKLKCIACENTFSVHINDDQSSFIIKEDMSGFKCENCGAIVDVSQKDIRELSNKKCKCGVGYKLERYTKAIRFAK